MTPIDYEEHMNDFDERTPVKCRHGRHSWEYKKDVSCRSVSGSSVRLDTIRYCRGCGEWQIFSKIREMWARGTSLYLYNPMKCP